LEAFIVVAGLTFSTFIIRNTLNAIAPALFTVRVVVIPAPDLAVRNRLSTFVALQATLKTTVLV